MRKLILAVAVSLDGFIEGPNGEYDWCFADQDYGMTDFLNQIDSLFMGRKSYEMAKSMEGKEGGTGFPKLKQYVFSSTLRQLDDGSILIKDHVNERVSELKKKEGKDIWLFGGASLASSLIGMGHLDRLWLAIHPVLLGSGKPLFQDLTERMWLNLTDSKVYETGLISTWYDVRNQKSNRET